MTHWKALFLLLFASAAAELRADYQQFLMLQARGGYGSVDQSEGNSQVSGQFVWVPVIKEGKEAFSLTSYFNSDYQDPPLEEENIFFYRSMALIKPSWRHELSNGWGSQLRVAATRTSNRETLDQKYFDNGYDFEEYGAGAGLQWQGKDRSSAINVDYSHRGYPNYREATAVFTLGKNITTKDFSGIKTSVAGDLKALGGNQRGTLSLAVNTYEDAYQVVRGGELDYAKVRQDSLYSLGWEGRWNLAKPYSVRSAINYSHNDSNQNFYSVSDRRFLPDYQDFSIMGLQAGLSWKPGDAKLGHAVNLSYNYALRGYPGRLTKDGAGAYTSSTQLDQDNGFNLDSRYGISSQFGVLLGGMWRNVSSNQAWTGVGKGSYNYMAANLGIEFKL